MPSTPLLELENLSTHYVSAQGTRVVRGVDDVSLRIHPGETLGIVGESGSGKSTLALTILRVLPPAARIVSGRMMFEGEDLLRKSDEEMQKIRGRRIAMILQDPMASLNPLFTIGNQVAEPIRVHEGATRATAWNRSRELLKSVRIPSPEPRVTQYPHEMSGGMRQRIVGAIGISCEPRLLIADEPTTSLDLTIQAQYLKLLRDLQRAHNLALIFITHNLGIVAKMCDRVAVMYAGRLVEAGPGKQIYKAPAHPHTPALLQSLSPRRGRHLVLDRPRQDLGGRRRVRLRQDDDGEDGAAARAADERHHALRRAGPADARRRDPARLPALRAGGVPGPVRVAESPHACRLDHRRAARHERVTGVGGGPQAPAAIARPGGAARALRRSVSARVLGWPAPANRDRARAFPLAQGHRARRAGLGARRVHPRPDPESPAGSPGPAGCVVPLHRPRPRRGGAHEAHDRRDVSRQDRGARRRRDGLEGAQAPVHAGALLGGAAVASRRAARRDHPGRRGAEPAGAAVRLPLPPALPLRAPALLERGADLAPRIRSPGRLPPLPEVRICEPPDVAGLGPRRSRRA